MLELICKRLLLAIPTLLLVSMMVFGLQKLLPGDPLIAMAGEERDPAVIAQLRAELNLDAPIPVQDQVGHQRPQPSGTAGETDHPGLLHAGLLQGKPPQHRGPDVCDLSHNQPPL